MLCITVAVADKFTNVLEGKVIGTSKHIDYALFHWKAKDVASLKKPITMFIFVGLDDKVTEVIFADKLKERGENYKTAKRDSTELNPAEQTEVMDAIALARAAPTTPPKKAAAPAAEPKPAGDAPKTFLTPAALAVGLAEVTARAQEAQGDAQQSAAEGDADHTPDEGTDNQPADDPPAADPLSTVEPSRINNKKKRR